MDLDVRAATLEMLARFDPPVSRVPTLQTGKVLLKMEARGAGGALVTCAGVSIAAASCAYCIDPEDLSFLVAAALLAGACALPVALSRSRAGLRIDHPSTIMGIIIACYWLLSGLYSRYDHAFLCMGAKENAWAAFLAGAVACAGFYLGAGLPDAKNAPPVIVTKSACTALGFLCVLLAVVRLSDIRRGAYFTHKAVVSLSQGPWEAVLAHAAYSMRVVPCMFAAGLWTRGRRGAAALVMLAESMYTLFTGSRLFVLHIAFFLAIAVSLLGHRVPMRWLALAGVVFVFGVNPLVYTMRQAVVADTVAKPTPIDVAGALLADSKGADHSQEFEELVTRGDAVSYLANSLCLMELSNTPLLGGSTYAESILLLVPRFVWPEKPALPGADLVGVITTRIGGRPQDAVGSPIAEAYLNFGFIGVGVVFAALGLIGRALWRYRIRNSESGVALGLYMMSLTVFVLFETHSTIGILTGFRVPLAGMLALWAYTAATTSPAHRVTA